MGDLISREALLKKVECGGWYERCCDACNAIKAAPAVDAEPVRRSRWHYHGDGYYFCGECKKYIVCIGGDADLNYCPNCGAKMDGDSDG